jgi:hypothetical protein
VKIVAENLGRDLTKLIDVQYVFDFDIYKHLADIFCFT